MANYLLRCAHRLSRSLTLAWGRQSSRPRFSVTPKCVRDTLPRYRETGSNESRPQNGRSQELTRHDVRMLWRLRRETPKTNTNHLLETPTQRRTTPALQSIDGYKTLVLRTSERRDDRILLGQPHKNGCSSAMSIETSTGVGPPLGSVTSVLFRRARGRIVSGFLDTHGRIESL
jgi:hypothetical protein